MIMLGSDKKLSVFDPAKLRDTDFKDNFYKKLKEVEEVLSQHSFIQYATQQALLDELEDIYEENLKAYQTHYLQPVSLLPSLEKKVEEHKANLFADRYDLLVQHLNKAKELLELPSYKRNQQAGNILKLVEKDLPDYAAEFENYTTALSNYRQGLHAMMTQMWAEDYAIHKRHYQHLRQLPPSKVSLKEIGPQIELVSEHIQKKKKDIEKALHKLRFFPAFRKKVASYSDMYAPLKDFKSALHTIRWKMMGLSLIGICVMSIFLFAAGWGLMQLPDWYAGYQERIDWEYARELHSYESYRAYMDRYPQGKYQQEAQEGIYNLNHDSIPTFRFEDSAPFSYHGDLLFGLPDGEGTAQYQNGSSYEGAWKKGKYHGIGKLVDVDQSTYVGNWDHGQKEGTGKQSFSNGNRYEGDWVENLIHGEGKMNYQDSSVYTGQWDKGIRSGKGSIIYPNEEKYEGYWEEDKISGMGSYWYADGNKYTGNWEEGKKSGQGKMDFADGRVYVGEWKEDVIHGVGKMIWPDQVIFVGKWNEGVISGQGILTDRFRVVYEGKWEQRKDTLLYFDGYGTLIKKGTVEDGMFIKN